MEVILERRLACSALLRLGSFKPKLLMKGVRVADVPMRPVWMIRNADQHRAGGKLLTLIKTTGSAHEAEHQNSIP